MVDFDKGVTAVDRSLHGYGTSPSPSFSISPSIFGFLKSLDLQSVGLKTDVIPFVNPITGWELVVYDLRVAESRVGGILSESVEYTVDMDVGHVGEEPVLETDSIIVEDIDEDEPILRFNRTVQTALQPNFKPGIKCQRKTATSTNIPLTPLVSHPKREVQVLPLFFLPKDRVDNPVTKKKSTLKTPTKTTTRTPSRPAQSKKLTQKRKASKQVSKLVEESDEPKRKKIRKNMALGERYEHFLQKSVVRGKVVKISYFQE